jgi:hypothetical protein
MARVQKTNQTNQKSKLNVSKQAQPKVNPKSKAELAKTNPKKEPSKNEILFFRIGLIVIGLTVIIGAVIVLIQYFMSTTEEVLPFDEYTHITVENLEAFVKEDEFGNFGQRDFYFGVDGYEDINEKINANDTMYVYFYRSSDLEQDVVDAILEIENLDALSFFFIDLDNNTAVGQVAGLSYLGLNPSASQMLLTFEYNPVNTEDPFFTVWSDTNNILIDINKL